MQARQQAALQDIAARQAVNEAMIQAQGQFLDAPLNRSRLAYEIGYLPEQEKNRQLNELMARLGYFNIGTGNPPPTQTPNIPTIPNSGMIAGAGLSSFGNALGNYFAMQPQQAAAAAPVMSFGNFGGASPTAFGVGGGTGGLGGFAPVTNLGSGTVYFPPGP